MIQLDSIQRTACHHIQRGDSMVMDPEVMLGLANSLIFAVNSLKRIRDLPRHTEACIVAEEALGFLGADIA